MRKLLFFIIGVVGIIIVVGCTKPVSHTSSPLHIYDKDTKYSIDTRTDGFAVTINYSRFQFVPESSAVATACKSNLTAIAWEYAEKVGRKIYPVNEQRIRISLGRNGIAGITSCQAHAIVKWKQ